jgi:hypothetical protein
MDLLGRERAVPCTQRVYRKIISMTKYPILIGRTLLWDSGRIQWDKIAFKIPRTTKRAN